MAIYQAVGQRLEAELLEKKSSVNWNLILSAETQSVEGLHPTHLPQDFYNKNQQGVLKLEEKTFVEVSKDLTIQQVTPMTDYAGEINTSSALDISASVYKDHYSGLQSKTEVEQAFNPEEVMTPECLQDIAQTLELVATTEGSEALEMLKDIRACMPPEALKTAANLLSKPLRNRIAEMVRSLNPPVETKPTPEQKTLIVIPRLPQGTKTKKAPAASLTQDEEAFLEWSTLENLKKIANEFLTPLTQVLPDQAIEKIKHLLTFIPIKALAFAAEFLTGSPRYMIEPLLLKFDIVLD